MVKNIILVAGSPGAGKTTILREVAASFNSTIVNMGTMMLQVGQKLGYVTDRDQLRFLDLKKFNELRNVALEEIEAMKGNIIIDTHATVGENGRYLPGFPMDVLDHLRHVKGVIYIDAATKDIMAHRHGDLSRRRENEDELTLDAQRRINLAMLSFASAYLNIPLYVVINRHGDLEKAVTEIRKRIKEAVGE